jgi:hypothetical protein
LPETGFSGLVFIFNFLKKERDPYGLTGDEYYRTTAAHGIATAKELFLV